MSIASQPTTGTNGKRSAAEARRAALAQFQALAQQSAVAQPSDLLQSMRQQAANLIQDQTLPTTRDEEWRFTDLSALLQHDWSVAERPSAVGLDAIASYPETQSSRLVFVNGLFSPELSDRSALPPHVLVGNLSDLPQAYASRCDRYLAKQPGGQEVFTALNTIGLKDAAIVWVPKNVVIEVPVRVVFLSTTAAQPLFVQPRCLVVAEPNSSLTLLEEYGAAGNTDSLYFTNAVTEVWLEDGAQVNHVRIQHDRTNSFHIGKTAVSQGRDARYVCHAVSLGAKLSRHHLEVQLLGEQSEVVLNGLTMISGHQLADTHSAIAYTKPHSMSRQLHKCIVDDRAHAVFNGKVFVPQAAQLTDAGQLNRNLLLSSKARVDTKPQLEIVADNVKCTHGATVGQLDSDEVFYLQSRGIDAISARQLLVYAFAYESIEQIPIASVRDALSRWVRLLSCPAGRAEPDPIL